MKCSKCRATNPILAKVCEACGYSPLETEPAEQDAVALATRLNDNLASLRARTPSGGLSPMIVGFFLLPTIGISWLIAKAIEVFGSPGKSAAKTQFELGSDLRAAETSYGTDPSFRVLIKQAEQVINVHAAAVRHAFKKLLTGLIAFVFVAFIIIGLVIFTSARTKAKNQVAAVAVAKDESKNTDRVIASLHSGNIEAAAAQIHQMQPDSLARLRATSPDIAVAALVSEGKLEAALEETAKMTDPETRNGAQSSIAERALEKLSSDFDNTNAQKLAAFIHPESRRFAAMDKLLAGEATRFILQNRYQDARAYIGGISSAQLRADLEARISERTGR